MSSTERARRGFVRNAAGVIVLSPLLAACGSDTLQPIEVARNDLAYPTEKNLQIGYMLSIWDWQREGLVLDRIVTLDDETGTVLLTTDQASMPKIHRGDQGTKYGVRMDHLTRCVVSLRLPVALDKAPPRSIRHRLVFTNGRIVEGGVLRPRIGEKPLEIASPVRGRNLLFFNQSTTGYHFDATFFRDGGIYTFERYAFDSLELNDSFTDMLSGDPKVNASYFNYGRPLYAVADGTVLQVENGRPENRGDARDVTFETLIELAGNFVLLDIGGGRYAGYAHCIPGSVLVRPGDKVRKGDVIASLGNSGNSTGPHLHFQVTDAPDFFWSQGVPFVIEGYTKTGETDGESPVHLPRQSFTHALMENTAVIEID